MRSAGGTPLVLLLLLAGLGCAERRADMYIASLSDADAGVRRRASYELVNMGGPAVEPLVAAARTGSDTLQYIAAQILGRIAHRRAVPFLRQLAQAENPHVRQEAVLALGKMGDAGLMPALGRLLVADQAPCVRAAAARSMAGCRDTTAVPILCQALADSSAQVRRQALASLDRLWTRGAADSVVQALGDSDETVRYIAAQMLGRRCIPNGVDSLCAALRDSSAWVRAEAARSLAQLGDPSVADDLISVMRRHDGPDHEAARLALRDLTGTDYVLADAASCPVE